MKHFKSTKKYFDGAFLLSWILDTEKAEKVQLSSSCAPLFVTNQGQAFSFPMRPSIRLDIK